MGLQGQYPLFTCPLFFPDVFEIIKIGFDDHVEKIMFILHHMLRSISLVMNVINIYCPSEMTKT